MKKMKVLLNEKNSNKFHVYHWSFQITRLVVMLLMILSLPLIISYSRLHPTNTTISSYLFYSATTTSSSSSSAMNVMAFHLDSFLGITAYKKGDLFKLGKEDKQGDEAILESRKQVVEEEEAEEAEKPLLEDRMFESSHKINNVENVLRTSASNKPEMTIFAIGDLHGDYECSIFWVKKTGLIEGNLRDLNTSWLFNYNLKLKITVSYTCACK